MIPSALTGQLQQGLADFLRFSFWSSTPGMTSVIEDLISLPGGLTKGPYVSLKLPFLPGKDPSFFPHVPLPFTPHAHQEEAFQRMGGRRKQSTLVATGTGSGKTECFLLPILAHCQREIGRPGIKAIIIYPMNALATDQAGRIARLINEAPALHGKITAGLYIGESKGKKRSGQTTMSAEQVISDRTVLQESPPDILLTNYKMLDYLLVRPRDQKVWRHNQRGTLRFLVVDELHTFDGAQGTDLACLIRRLKRRLEVDDGSLCCVGTSATLGSGKSGDRLRTYAQQVFGEPLDANAIVGEHRLDIETFLGGSEVDTTDEPGPADLDALDPCRHIDPMVWLQRQEQLWLGPSDEKPGSDAWAVSLGVRLKRHATFHALLHGLDDRVVALDDLLQDLSRSRSDWRQTPDLGRAAIIGMLGLASAARSYRAELPELRAEREASGNPRPTEPLVDVRVQLWQRELRRMVATVGQRPALTFSDDLDRQQKRRHLPLVHCRDCGAMGWATLLDRDRRHVLRANLTNFYRAYFSNNPQVALLWPAAAVGKARGWEDRPVMRVDASDLVVLDSDEEPEGEAIELIQSDSVRSFNNKKVLSKDCPFCDARDSLTLVGFRAASLTAVYIDQLFASHFNDDRKLLTFSDSVQDAAHRAGFFGARTWHTCLRLALQETIREHEGELVLSDLPDQVVAHYQAAMDQPTWIASFLSPYMVWLHDWGTLQKNGRLPTDSDLPRLVARRLYWDVMSEYGLQATIGRSLPRTRSSTVHLDMERLDRAANQCLEPLRNEVPGLREVSVARVRSFLLGLLTHLRHRGGIMHKQMPARYLESCGRDTYVFKMGTHLPDFARTSRMPAFLTDHTGSPRFDSWGAGSGSRPGWYDRWVSRSLSAGAALEADAGFTYPVVLPILVAEGLLKETTGVKGEHIWGLIPDVIRVTSRVEGVRCTGCGMRLPVAETEAFAWAGAPCLSARCEGTLEPDPVPPPDYFGRLYDHGSFNRVYTAEHTGLLQREEREGVETEFKAPPKPAPDADPERAWRKPWYPNLLSCTPTLEMGIDIGDLSSAVLCSIPPAQANYLQRIGRAGRRDGNALILAVANARPHDLYFYADPEEMMEGEVSPPGVFLDAAAVLERQLCAFCFDRWGAREGDNAVLPVKLSDIFAHLDEEGTEHFPHSLLAFVADEQPTILREFLEMFGKAITTASQKHLRTYLEGDDEGRAGLRWRLLEAFHDERKQRESLAAKVRQLRKQIKKLRTAEAKPEDWEERVEELELEKDALAGLVGAVDRRGTLELLTDRGLLPNYAFPESAVRLTSVIWRKKKKAPAKGTKYDTWTFEYARSPTSALSELAPGSTFYAGGRRVQVDQVDVAVSTPEIWRFCDACSHAQRADAGDHPGACPACGSTNWRDDGQKLRMLPLQQVFARTPDKESRIRDDQDERQPRFYQRELLVAFRDEDRKGAWFIKDPALPFGFEFLARATFREVNFGEQSEQGPKTTIAGKETVRPGFDICMRCGMVQRPHKEPIHNFSCPTRTHGAEEEVLPCLYLYREFSSEALRLLLPMADMATQQQLNSFVAAMQVGLKEWFHGQVDHLHTTVTSEPVEGSSLRKSFLVLFDTVPGGTGYIKQLITPKKKGDEAPILTVLKMARDKLVACPCQSDPERDGCYRCLLGYRNSRDMDDTSSDVAVELIDKILKRKGKLAKTKSLGTVSITGLMDSVLEARFVEALRQAKVGGKKARFWSDIVHNKSGYRMKLGDQHWSIEPQVDLGQRDGFAMGISIDFVLRPGGGASAGDRLPIAVFLDGWEFHQDRIGKDLLQRQLLLASGQWDVWSFTWADLDEVLTKKGKAEVTNVVHPDLAAVRSALQKNKLGDWREVAERPIFETFVQELAADASPDWCTIAGIIVATRAQPASPDKIAEWPSRMEQLAPPQIASNLAGAKPRGLVTDSGDLSPWVTLDAAHDGQGITLLCRLDDREDHRKDKGFRAAWNGYLRLFQLLRGLPGAWFVTTSSMEGQPLHLLAAMRSGPSGMPAWPGIDDMEDTFQPLAVQLNEASVTTPILAKDIPGQRSPVWAEAEFLWEDLRVAVTDRDRQEYATGAPADDWKVFILEDLEGGAEPLLAALGLGRES